MLIKKWILVLQAKNGMSHFRAIIYLKNVRFTIIIYLFYKKIYLYSIKSIGKMELTDVNFQKSIHLEFTFSSMQNL